MTQRLTSAQERTLRALDLWPHGIFVTAKAISRVMGFRGSASSNVSRTLDRLAEMGLAEAAMSTSTRPRPIWRITDAGLDRIKES